MIDDIVDEFTVALRLYDTRASKDSKMLGGNRLFEAKVNVDLGDGEFFIFIQQTDDLLTEFVIECS